ncbi:MAG: xanthine dehydrogenase accessory protein XdhC [Xanthomonadales bacterium]|nr:xanthine dehydrogenase accessory protein XdhC [Xanthomonadales bacterium]
MDWPLILKHVLEQQPCVLVTLNLILGSVPRESGSRMVVTATQVHGSIGGGNLEYSAIQQARQLLADSDRARQSHGPWGLGPALNQCCGGAVTLHFEVLPQGSPDWLDHLNTAVQEDAPAVLASAIDRDPPVHVVLRAVPAASISIPAEVSHACAALLASQEGPWTVQSSGQAQDHIVVVERAGDTWWLEAVRSRRVPLVLFGAGHVGREVARLLERLPFDVTWIDSREGTLPFKTAGDIPDHTPGKRHMVYTADPAAEAILASPASVFVVMTHSHQLDEDICCEILTRGDFCWLGLIGSETKRRRFVQRLNKRGVRPDLLDRLSCPIGLVGIHGKQPATIALSLVAQLMLEKPWMKENN